MAYSDYGAYVWKNGELVRGNQYLDTAFIYLENRGWICTDDLSEEEYENSLIMDEDNRLAKNICEGHAVIKLTDDLCLGFYKTHGIKIYNKLDLKVYDYDLVKKKSDFKYNKDLKFSGYPLNDIESIWRYDITYKEDHYCVMVGSSVGNGFDKNHISKLLLKLVQFGNRYGTRHNDELFYYLQYKDKDYYPEFEMIEHAIRRDNVDFEKYLMWNFGTKPMLKCILKLKFKDAYWYYTQRREHKLKIKYLK